MGSSVDRDTIRPFCWNSSSGFLLYSKKRLLLLRGDMAIGTWDRKYRYCRTGLWGTERYIEHIVCDGWLPNQSYSESGSFHHLTWLRTVFHRKRSLVLNATLGDVCIWGWDMTSVNLTHISFLQFKAHWLTFLNTNLGSTYDCKTIQWLILMHLFWCYHFYSSNLHTQGWHINGF